MPLNIQNFEKLLPSSVIAKPIALQEANGSGVKIVRLNGEYSFHSHDVDEVFVILEGELIMDLEDMDSQRLAKGDVIKVPAKQRHRTRTMTPSNVLLVGPR